MARWSINNVGFRGVSACVPKEVVKTEDIPLFSAEEAQVFNNTVGICERRLAPDSICASDLCQAAAEKLLAQLNWEKESIDMLVFESVTGDYKTPPTACLLQDRLGLSEDCFCVDLPMGCCGCMYAINVAGNMLTTGNIHRALLLIGDTALRMGSMQDKSRVPLFGDMGTAIALEYDTHAEPIIIDFHTQGSGYKALMTPPAKSVAGLIEELGIDKDNDIDYYLIHQANKLIVDRLVKKLKLPQEKVPYNLQQFGNTGGASIPSLMVTRIADRLRVSENTHLLCSSFGLGLSWGTMLLNIKNVVIPELIEI